MREADCYSYWYDAFTKICKWMENDFKRYIENGSGQMKRIKLLFIKRARKFFGMYIYFGEYDENYNECIKLADEIMANVLEEELSGSWSEEEKQEFKKFYEECPDYFEPIEELYAFVKNILPDVQDNEIMEKIYKEARYWHDSIKANFETFQMSRKSKFIKDDDEGSEPPPWLDEFEYIDWMITH